MLFYYKEDIGLENIFFETFCQKMIIETVRVL